MFESADWVHIEIGNSEDRSFLDELKKKYPHVDIFLDDGGHTMNQQKVAMEVMLPHVQPEGVFMCEDLSTSWGKAFGGRANEDVRSADFLKMTTMGLVHKTIDWLHAGLVSGAVMKHADPRAGFFEESWWPVILNMVRHIHIYNQVVVYEKGRTYQAQSVRTFGFTIPYKNSGSKTPVDWDKIMKTITEKTNSPWKW
jgi:hypothetical protein